jgi:hypothetical protein
VAGVTLLSHRSSVLDDDSPRPGSRGRRAEPRDEPRELICLGMPDVWPGRGTGTIASDRIGERGVPLSEASLRPPRADLERGEPRPSRVPGRPALGGVGAPNTEEPVEPITVLAVLGRNASAMGGMATSIANPAAGRRPGGCSSCCGSAALPPQLARSARARTQDGPAAAARGVLPVAVLAGSFHSGSKGQNGSVCTRVRVSHW